MKDSLIYEGKAKRIYSVKGDNDNYIQEFKDDATAFNGLKKDSIKNKGIRNTSISTSIFTFLNDKGIPTHYLGKISENEMLVKKVEIILVEVVCRNIAAGSLVKKFGFTEGEKLEKPLIEFYYKSDEAGDPLFTDEHIFRMKLATFNELSTIKSLTFKINELLKDFFSEKGIDLVDFKLEFGRNNGEIILADEISPDTCRLWDKETGMKLDKDRFRFDMGGVEEAYEEIEKRLK
ncbi:phosphoribosylaminoimidazolesuccinocarboxamide synthase [soil metagenome]